ALFSSSSRALYAFFAPLTFCAITLMVSGATSFRRSSINGVSHRRLLEAWSWPEIIPTVDVFLPTAGEPVDVLSNTYTHVARLEWPVTLTVHVLDDAARSEVRALALEFGFTYHCRPNRGHLRKAGNLRYGFEQSTGDVIAVFDADFAPRPDFVHE